MMKYLIPAVISFLVLFSSCAAKKELIPEEPLIHIEEIHTKEHVETLVEVPSDWVETTLRNLSLEEKVAQMIMARAFSHYISEETDQYQELLRLVRERKVGGIAFFQGDISELALLTNELQYHADVPLLFAADFERGIAMRLRRGTLFPVAMAVGAARDHLLSYRMGKAIAKEGRALGIHQNFTPVVDINNNHNNPVGIAAVKAVQAGTDIVRIDPRSNKIDFDSLLRKAEGAELIISALYVQARSGQGRIGIPESFNNIQKLITNSIEDGAFPGAVVVVGDKNNILYRETFGALTYNKDAPPVEMSTIYDLASLTKVVATTTAIMHLYDKKKIELDKPAGFYIPELNTSGKKEIAIRHLLTHTSGFPAFKEYYRELTSPDEIMRRIVETPLDFMPGEKVQYSDIGMIILGKVVEKISGLTLDEYLRKHFFDPLGMHDTMFNPPIELKSRIAPTEVDTVWRHRLIQGEVHDENAFAMGGIAGHAGLFSTAYDLSIFARMILNEGEYNGEQFLNPETIRYFTTRDEKSRRGLGWDIKSESGYSSAGALFSSPSFGHTGFTGTSLWIDPERNLYVIFLTNRVHPTRINAKIIDIRPLLHDYVIMMHQQYGDN